MKTKLLTIGILATALMTLAACSSVKLKQPFVAVADPPDKARLEGIWKCGDSLVYLSFATNGIAQLHMPGWEKGVFRVDTGELITAPGRDQNYFCVRGTSGETTSDVHDLAAYRLIDDEQLVFWWADYDAFAAALDAKKIEGAVTGSNYEKRVIISSPPAKLLEFLENPANAKLLFDFNNPIIVRKVGPGPR